MSGAAMPNAFQQIALVLLRTLVGWHFAWEGFIKLFRPSWSREGWPLLPWSAEGYLRGASGPLAETFHGLAESGWMGMVDLGIAVLLLVTGLSLMLGLFTRTGTVSALLLLILFYLLYVPTSGVKGPGTEGNYLIVDKNLVEAAAVLVLLVFDTGRLAGLDLLMSRRRVRAALDDVAAADDEPAPATEAAS